LYHFFEKGDNSLMLLFLTLFGWQCGSFLFSILFWLWYWNREL